LPPRRWARWGWRRGEGWSTRDRKGGRRSGRAAGALGREPADADFVWPGAVAFLADDCSVYVPLNGDAWGVCFRIGDWTRAYTMFDLPCPSKIGRKLCVLDPLGPEAEPRVLIDAGGGVIGSPSVSYDGQSIYVAMAPEGTSFFHIYRVPVDGGSPQQLTSGPFHDIDPAELPDGRIVFTSTRIGTFEEYHAAPSRALFVMQPDGSGIRRSRTRPSSTTSRRCWPTGGSPSCAATTFSAGPRSRPRFTRSGRTARPGRPFGADVGRSTACGCACWATAARRRCPTDAWPFSPTAAISWPNRARRSHRSTGFPTGWATWRRCRTDVAGHGAHSNPPTGAPACWRSSIRPTTGWCRSMSRPTPHPFARLPRVRGRARRCCPTR
jgi:hypothetical protein